MLNKVLKLLMCLIEKTLALRMTLLNKQIKFYCLRMTLALRMTLLNKQIKFYCLRMNSPEHPNTFIIFPVTAVVNNKLQTVMNFALYVNFCHIMGFV